MIESDADPPLMAATLAEFTAGTRAELLGHLGEVVGGQSVVHVGFCGHKNPGDNAISVAERRLLTAAGAKIDVLLTDETLTHTPERAAARLQRQSAAFVVIRGGGLFTDLYPATLEWWIRATRVVRDRPILQMPLSIHFSDLRSADPLKRAIAELKHFRLLVRDRPSYDWAITNLDCPVHLVPDSVLSLTPAVRTREPLHPVALLARRDGEAAPGRGVVPDLPVLPWMSEPRAYRDARLLPARLQARFDLPGPIATWVAARSARGRYARAVDMLSSAGAVVSDRFHGVLMCLLHGIPVVGIDNSYGKISAGIRTWRLDEFADVTLADTFSAGVELLDARVADAPRGRIG